MAVEAPVLEGGLYHAVLEIGVTETYSMARRGPLLIGLLMTLSTRFGGRGKSIHRRACDGRETPRKQRVVWGSL